MNKHSPKTRLVEIKSLTVNYSGGHTALRNISLTVNSGEILGIVGESGSGKTTLIRALINLLNSGASISSGQIFLFGREASSFSTEEWRQLRGGRVAMIFQNPGATLSPMVSVKRQFIEAIRNHKSVSKSEAEKIAYREILNLGLKDPKMVLNSRPWQLSGGMKQRVAISMSLAINPRLILADEPTSALDVSTQELVMAELNNRRKERETAVILVSHNICACASVADKLIVMKEGMIVDFGSVSELLSRSEDTYTGQLFRSVPHLKGMQCNE